MLFQVQQVNLQFHVGTSDQLPTHTDSIVHQLQIDRLVLTSRSDYTKICIALVFCSIKLERTCCIWSPLGMRFNILDRDRRKKHNFIYWTIEQCLFFQILIYSAKLKRYSTFYFSSIYNLQKLCWSMTWKHNFAKLSSVQTGIFN